MTLWDRSESTREKERLANAALLAVETGRQRALEDFHSLADSTDAQTASEVATLDAQLSAKRHRLATLLEQQNPPVDMIATLRSEISLLRTQIDIAQTKPLTDHPRPTRCGCLGRSPKSRRRCSRAKRCSSISWDAQSRLWAVTREGLSVAPLSGRARIEDAARELYQMWSTPARLSMPARTGASRIILGEDTSWLRPEGTVVVVADGILRSLPFGALLGRKPGRGAAADRDHQRGVVPFHAAQRRKLSVRAALRTPPTGSCSSVTRLRRSARPPRPPRSSSTLGRCRRCRVAAAKFRTSPQLPPTGAVTSCSARRRRSRPCSACRSTPSARSISRRTRGSTFRTRSSHR